MTTQPTPIVSQPGIKRDGTRLSGDFYVDGQWCRFVNGRPRKILGYNRVTKGVPEIVYGMNSFSVNNDQYVHGGSASEFQQYRVNNDGNLLLQLDRTPSALTVDDDNLWQVDYFYDQVAGESRVVAHAAPNLQDIASDAEREVWIGNAAEPDPLVDSTIDSVSGGIVAVGPYLFVFGNSGSIGWSDVNDPSTLNNEAFITEQKVVRGMPLRGGSGPAALFWSLNALIRASFTGGASVWNFDTITSFTSIMSSRSAVEYDGIYFWAGVDRFLMFNGVVREVPNQLNADWFFDNLNFDQRQKVFAFKVPRFGEIWWCYPRGSATECTHAVIFKVRDGTWYDTELPNSGRSDAVYAKVHRRPYMFGVDQDDLSSGYYLWQHENGVDEVDGAATRAVPSHFETSEMSMLKSQQSSSLRVELVEPDFVQTGLLRMIVRGRHNARDSVTESDPHDIDESASSPDQETVKLRETRRLLSFRFESNVAGGYYEYGETYAHVGEHDDRVES